MTDEQVCQPSCGTCGIPCPAQPAGWYGTPEGQFCNYDHLPEKWQRIVCDRGRSWLDLSDPASDVPPPIRATA